MAIDPKILARLSKNLPPQDDGSDGNAWDGDESELRRIPPGVEGLPKDKHPGCAVLVGSWKQRKWAIDLRNGALALKWPEDVYNKLRSITDATWWIANSSIARTMKYKEPSPQQIGGSIAGRSAQPGTSSSAPAATISSRLNDAAAFAASVSKDSLQAEATILALFARLYKSPMRDDLNALAKEKYQQANFETGRDLNAIERLLKL